MNAQLKTSWLVAALGSTSLIGLTAPAMAQDAAPNLLITQQNSGGPAANLAIRGLTYADIEKSQEPTVVVDGVFIASDEARYITGAEFTVDGGLTAM